MKRWAVLTVALYVLILLALTAPVIKLFSWADWGIDAREAYSSLPYWVGIGLLATAQALLLLAPVAHAERRPRARRRVLSTVITSALFFAALLVGALLSIGAAVWGDDVPGVGSAWPPVLLLIVLWAVWGWVFYRFSSAGDSRAMSMRLMRWLLGGSILEMLVAVTSHIISRRRGDCCAPTNTFFLFAAGFAIMLLSFGPGVYFLFVERRRRLRPRNRKATEEPSS